MIRRPTIAPALLAALIVLVAACGSGPSAPALTDPTEIVTAALKSAEAARSVHVDVALSGSATVDLPIGGAGGTSVDLAGATINGDVDLANGAAKATFALPGLLGLAGEVIVVDGTTYLKTTLTGTKYQQVGDLPIDLGDGSGLIDDLGDLLLKEGVVLTKGGDVACGTEQCYTVSTTITAEQLGLAGANVPSLPIDIAGASMTLTVQVEQDAPNHLAGVTAVITMPDGSATATATFSKWDEPVSIAAPPADQVAGGS